MKEKNNQFTKVMRILILALFFCSAMGITSCEKEDRSVPLSSIGKEIPKNLFDCPADLTGDGAVTIEDFILFVGSYEQACDGCPADLDGNGFVDVVDFTQFNTAWENPCDLNTTTVSVFPLGARFRFGDNDYPTEPIDPPIPNGSNLALGGVTITGLDALGAPVSASVLASDSLHIKINGGDGEYVYYDGALLAGKTITHINGVTPENQYGYWRMSGRTQICNGALGADYDYEVEYFGLMYKVSYEIFYSEPGYPEVMEGTSYAYGLYESPIDDSCLNPSVFMAYPLEWDGLYVGDTYTIYN